MWEFGCRVALWWRIWIKAGGGRQGGGGKTQSILRSQTEHLQTPAPLTDWVTCRLPSTPKQPAVRRPCSWTHILHRAAFSASSLCRVTLRSPSSQSALLGFLTSVLAGGLQWLKVMHVCTPQRYQARCLWYGRGFSGVWGRAQWSRRRNVFCRPRLIAPPVDVKMLSYFIIPPSLSCCQVDFVSFYWLFLFTCEC